MNHSMTRGAMAARTMDQGGAMAGAGMEDGGTAVPLDCGARGVEAIPALSQFRTMR